MNKLKQEIEEYLTRDYCCEFKKECKDGVRVRCSEYEAKLYLILRFAEPREKQIQIDAEHIRALQKTNGTLTDRVNELESQIEKMKCCPTCDNNKVEHTPEEQYRCKTCRKFCNWELAD